MCYFGTAFSLGEEAVSGSEGNFVVIFRVFTSSRNYNNKVFYQLARLVSKFDTCYLL